MQIALNLEINQINQLMKIIGVLRSVTENVWLAHLHLDPDTMEFVVSRVDCARRFQICPDTYIHEFFL